MLPAISLTSALALAADTSVLLAGNGQASVSTTLDGPEVAFDEVELAPIFLWREGDHVLVESELQFVLGAEGFAAALEYASVSFDTGRGPLITAGQFLTPVGHFMPRMHPAWIDKFYDFPLPYRVGPLPMAHAGLKVQQVLRPGLIDRFVLVAWVDNGPGGAEGAPLVQPRIGDDNLDKGLGGRIGVLPVPEVEIAGSAYTGAYAADSGERYLVVVGDAVWTHGGWLDLRGEAMRATWEGGSFAGAWAWAGWRIRQVEALRHFEPVLRFGWAQGDTPAAPDGEEEGGHAHGASGVELGDEPLYEICAGLNTYLRSNVVLKASLSHHTEDYAPTVHVSVGVGL